MSEIETHFLFYVLHGEDEYTRKAQLHALRDAMNDPNNLNLSLFEGATASPREILNAASSYPFLSDKRIVIVEGMLTFLAKKGKSGQDDLDTLVAGLANLPDFARVIFHEDGTLPDKNPVIKLIHSNPRGYHKAFNAPNNMAAWIKQQAQKGYQIEIEAPAVSALASVVNKDLRAADSELAKLAAYVDYKRPITEFDVALLTPYVAEVTVFELVDAIGKQDGKNAMRLLRQLLTEGTEPLSLFGMINRQFRMMLLAREYMDMGGNGTMAEAIGTSSDFVVKKVKEQANRFTLASLEAIYRRLAEYDFEIKTGKVGDEMALEMFVAAVAR